MTIGVIGAGRLGICFALLLEHAGYNVIVSDIRDNYIDSINKKLINTTEPSVNDLLQSTKNFTATTNNKDVINQSDIIYCFVPTPSTERGNYNIDAIWQIVEDFKNSNSTNKVFVIGSTVNPGDCKLIQDSLYELNVRVFYNPEFVAQGTIIKNLQYADITLIGGNDNDDRRLIESLYHSIQISKPNIHCMSTTAAEISKLAINSFLTIKISYANMIGDVLVNNNMEDEIATVLKCIGDDSRIGKKFLNYGFGFGGPCLPRDNKSMVEFASKTQTDYSLGSVVDNFNNTHSAFLKNYYINKNPNKHIPFYFDYISYKQGTDILTESQQYKLCYDLLQEGYTVYINDIPSVIEQVRKHLTEQFPNKVYFANESATPKILYKINL